MNSHDGGPLPRRGAGDSPEAKPRQRRPSGLGDAYPDVLPREQRVETLLMAGIWLFFLTFPAWQLLQSPDFGPGTKTLGIAALLVFCVIYLVAFVHTRPLPMLPRWANTLLYQCVLLGVLVAGVPSIGTDIVLTAPFLCALWLFRHDWSVGLTGTAGVVLLGLVLVWFFAPVEDRTWAFIPLVVSVCFILAVRYASGREDRTRGLKEQLALTAQREAFGREVHDALGHSLTLMSVKVQLARRLIRTEPARAEAELDEVHELIAASISEARSVVNRVGEDADPLTLDEQLAAAARALRAADIATELPTATALSSLTPEKDAVFAACLREAVTNIIRHSRATRVCIDVDPDRLVVVDDGVGGALGRDGHGIPGMSARARAASANLRVTDADPGRTRPGTRVEVAFGQ